MDITDLRSIATVAILITFVGIWIWAWSGRHKKILTKRQDCRLMEMKND